MEVSRVSEPAEHEAYRWSPGEGPLVAVALHDGHYVRAEVARLLRIYEKDRLREEDPFTGIWTSVGQSQVIALRSRFEVDLNRARDKAVYLRPEEAWGLDVWREPPPADVINRSLEIHDAFYRQAEKELEALRERHGRFVVFDLHSYNHRRAGPHRPPDDPEANPDVNLGTGTMKRPLWAPLVERFLAEMRAFDFRGGRLDVRENVRFRGGYFAQWVHQTFPDSGCALSIEFKKFFMDEWTGQPDPAAITAIGAALRGAARGLLEELDRMT